MCGDLQCRGDISWLKGPEDGGGLRLEIDDSEFHGGLGTGGLKGDDGGV
ncbi:MAG: hypothetical protein WC309_00965 [Candidatus Paceibacterota bacterium]|jgi:hypothetical protein